MNRFLLTLATAILISACGSDSSDDKEKSLFSLWKSVDGEETLDLNGGAFSKAQSWIYFPDSSGSQCNCELTLIGTESQGNYIINSCRYVSGSSSVGDPGCNSLNQTGTYKKSSDTLRICIAEPNCVEYK
ncbi:hypothetical protein [Bacterioplanoides pacificum]|uniref:Lipoprotein n=1 Tax=Bacterioplanoides pacificum TaxID=1171596 RepID=A0ABV7VS24_9GAMM